MDKIRKQERKNWFYSYNMIFSLKISEHAKLIYIFLCRSADAETQCFPSYNYIGEACGIKSRTTIATALKELETAGLIERAAQYNSDGRQTSNCYYIYDTPRNNTPEAADIKEQSGDKEEAAEASASCSESEYTNNENDSVHLMDTRVSAEWTGGCPSNGHEVLPINKYYPYEVTTTTDKADVVVDQSININDLKKEVDKTIGGDVNIKVLTGLLNKKGIEKIRFCLYNWLGIIGAQKIDSVESFFVRAVTEGYKVQTQRCPPKGTGNSNRSNFEEREYPQEYYENGFFSNVSINVHDNRYNERYVRDISKKIRANLRFKIEQGEYIGNAPYGYVKSVNEKNKLVVDARTAPVVREIFGLYKQGYGYAAIANMLNGKGYPSPSSKNSDIPITPWNQVAVQRILCNRVYIGDTVQGVSEKISFKNKKTRRLPFDKWIITTNTHEPIVKNEDFEEVQKIRAKKRSNQGYNRNISHLLSNMLYCGKCGKAMYVRVRKDRPVGYICSSYSKNGSECCSSHYVTEQTIIDVISDELLEMLSNRELIDSFSLKYSNEEDDRQKRYEMAQKLEQQIAAKQKQQDILYLDRLETKISEQLFTRMNKNIEERISILKKETEKLLEEEKKQLDKMHVVENFINRIKNQGINKNIIEQMVSRIIVYDSSDSAELKHAGMSGEEIKNGLIVIEYNYNNWREG